ncbi:MAG: hypothetical protein WBM66_15410 [Thiothrix litoralis]
MSQYPHRDPVEEARLLLPWYITEKLSAPERKLVEQMLAEHPELQEEYRRELNMVDMIRANTGLLQLSAMDTTNARLDKLMKRIEREEQTKASATPVTIPRQPEPKTAVRGIKSWLTDWLPTFEWLTPGNAAFALLLLVQAGFLGWFANSMISPTSNVYNVATVADDQAATSVAKGLVLLVDFNEEAQVRQVRDFLRQWDARILDGPDDNNLFKIEVKGIQPHDQQQSSTVLQQM